MTSLVVFPFNLLRLSQIFQFPVSDESELMTGE